MKGKCKCKNRDKYSIVEGIGIKCDKCFKWITRFRKNFHRKTQIKKNKKIYNRKKTRED